MIFMFASTLAHRAASLRIGCALTVVFIVHRPGLMLRLAFAWQFAWIPADACPEPPPPLALPAARAPALAVQSPTRLAFKLGGVHSSVVFTLIASRMKLAIAL